MINISNIKQIFQEDLKEIYPKKEINSLFHIAAESILKQDKLSLMVNKEQALSESEKIAFTAVLEKLKKQIPIQYILEEAFFYGLKLYVNDNVLIPRFETEELVELIVQTTTQNKPNYILDIGTGSGCIALALKKELNATNVFAVDVSSEALEVAQKNATQTNLLIQSLLMDILQETKWEHSPFLDIIVSNPPYIPLSEKALMHDNVLKYEPHLALFVDNQEPLIFYEKIADFALQHLKPNGHLFFEMNEFNAQAVKEMVAHKGFKNVEIVKDMYGKERMLKAEKRS